MDRSSDGSAGAVAVGTRAPAAAVWGSPRSRPGECGKGRVKSGRTAGQEERALLPPVCGPLHGVDGARRGRAPECGCKPRPPRKAGVYAWTPSFLVFLCLSFPALVCWLF